MALALLAAAVVGMGYHIELAAQSTDCVWQPGFTISRDTIGPVATTDPIASVPRRCAARDTLYERGQAERPELLGSHL